MEEKQLPQLSKMSATYKMVIPSNVEEKIRYLLRKFPSTEWSGVLFYTHEGSFENNDIVITCQDIFPMDLGSSVYTDFNMNEDVAAYIADNIELFDCDLGLIHSHHSMETQFSGTDTSTLRSEGNERNCFVSLIVNNAGTYSAAITRKIQKKTEVVTKSLGTSYEFFGEGAISTDKDPMSEATKIVDSEVIEYFMLNVEREIVDNPLGYLDKRFEEIKEKKTKQSSWLSGSNNYKPLGKVLNDPMPFPKDNKNTASIYSSGYDDGFYKWWDEKKKEKEKAKKEPLLFDDEDLKEMEAGIVEYVPNPTLIRNTLIQMLACSLNINVDKNFDLGTWITKHMKRIYDKAFKDINDVSSTEKFDVWCDFIVDYMVNTYFQDPDIPYSYEDYAPAIADAMLKQLRPYEDANLYIQAYIDTLESYAETL